MAPKKGDELIIQGGIYAGKKGWIDPHGSTTKAKVAVLVEVEDSDGEKFLKHTKINKTSCILKKNKTEPATITAALLEDHPQVKKDFDTLAKNMARLGIVDGKDAAEMFYDRVNKHIAALKKKGSKANYFPVKIEEGMYRSFYDSGPSATKNSKAKELKRGFTDQNDMNTNEE